MDRSHFSGIYAYGMYTQQIDLLRYEARLPKNNKRVRNINLEIIPKIKILVFLIIIIILGSYLALFLLLAQSALHSITPARVASLGNLTYCCHERC